MFAILGAVNQVANGYAARVKEDNRLKLAAFKIVAPQQYKLDASKQLLKIQSEIANDSDLQTIFASLDLQ